jgi:hypothetical protein
VKALRFLALHLLLGYTDTAQVVNTISLLHDVSVIFAVDPGKILYAELKRIALAPLCLEAGS